MRAPLGNNGLFPQWFRELPKLRALANFWMAAGEKWRNYVGRLSVPGPQVRGVPIGSHTLCAAVAAAIGNKRQRHEYDGTL
jgi:hypothetical protein